MIRLEVEPYCQDCLDFSPDMIEPQRMRTANKELVFSDTVIQCEYRKRCMNIKRFLERQMRGETEE